MDFGPDGVYFYSKRIDFKPGEDYVPIYRTNMHIYQVANYVDGVASSLAVLSAYKFIRQLFYMQQASGNFSLTSTCMWASLLGLQSIYLFTAYRQHANLIEVIELHRDMKQVRMRTITSGLSYNLIALMSNVNKSTEHHFNIGQVRFSENDDPEQ